MAGFQSACRTALALLAASLPTSRGHGYIVEPPARNLVDMSSTGGNCPHCGNGNGVCGDGGQWSGSNYYLRAVQQPQRTYTAGSVVRLEVSMNVNHKGHHEFFICDRPISSTSGAVECLQKWPLMRVPPEEVHSDCRVNDPREDCQPIDPNFPGRWYHPPGMSVHRIRYRIPKDLQCSHCTLQWFWPTSNSAPYDPVSYSCYQRHLKSMGWASFDFCGWACSDSKCPTPYTPGRNRAPDPSVGSGYEEFRNCADIRVLAAAGGLPAPTPAPVRSPAAPTPAPVATPVQPPARPPAPAPAPIPVASPVRPPARAPAPAPVMPPAGTPAPSTGTCEPTGDCGGAPCDPGAFVAWCAAAGKAGVCPAPFCKARAAAPEPEPEAEPEPEPEPQGAACLPTMSPYRLYCEQQARAGKCPSPWCKMGVSATQTARRARVSLRSSLRSALSAGAALVQEQSCLDRVVAHEGEEELEGEGELEGEEEL